MAKDKDKDKDLDREMAEVLGMTDQWTEEIVSCLDLWADQGRLNALATYMVEQGNETSEALARSNSRDDWLRHTAAICGLLGLARVLEIYTERRREG